MSEKMLCAYCGGEMQLRRGDRLWCFACCYSIHQSKWNTRHAGAEGEMVLGRLLGKLRSMYADVSALIARGKGTWPQNDYVRDETWAHWQGESIALRELLRCAGIDPDESPATGEEREGK